MKKCKECGNEFNPTNNRGSEQLYCSSTCRNKAAIKRHNLKIQNNGKHTSLDKGGSEISQRVYEGIGTTVQTADRSIADDGQISRGIPASMDGNVIACIKETYAARVSETFYKLKCENLEAEVQKLRQEIIDLELEISELEEKEEESEDQGGGMLSGIMQQFKTDPVNTINFTTELLQNLFKKSKPDATKKSS